MRKNPGALITILLTTVWLLLAWGSTAAQDLPTLAYGFVASASVTPLQNA
ncbi:MAG: hypothetical protein ACOCX3_01705 [Chloroflexota bacterium]